uniref:REJ domain-containing protein n=1 Tax=Strongyloides venezuelensis TaxID=75913 RepID=A0A0K0G2X8_STRVS
MVKDKNIDKSAKLFQSLFYHNEIFLHWNFEKLWNHTQNDSNDGSSGSLTSDNSTSLYYFNFLIDKETYNATGNYKLILKAPLGYSSNESAINVPLKYSLTSPTRDRIFWDSTCSENVFLLKKGGEDQIDFIVLFLLKQ